MRVFMRQDKSKRENGHVEYFAKDHFPNTTEPK